jgi:bis(5'-nucleosyl)-tetraphosphatase (symmetrical)
MAMWAIGDVQGCLKSAQALIARLEAQDAHAHFWFCGDLVNRGPDSLGTLKWVQTLAQQGRARTVLGNHDLFALACAAGVVQPKPQDTLTELLAAPEAWVDWLRHQPLAIHDQGFLLSHAGVFPAWSIAQTLALAGAVEQALRAPDWAARLKTLWHGGARLWHRDLSALDAQRFTVNALMRMRFIAPDGGLDFELKESAAAAPAGYVPWFDAAPRAMAEAVLVFGHWSALGLINAPRMIALDTGCVWGRELTAVTLALDPSQRRVVQVAALEKTPRAAP